MKKLIWFLLIGGGIYLAYRGLRTASKALKPKELLPAGAVFTGKTQVTNNGRPPNYPAEVIGYSVRNWAEIKTSDGSTDWVEIA